jgi:hypothetical protein
MAQLPQKISLGYIPRGGYPMSESDILAVQLFIGSLAAGAAAVAMTQAGWTHKWFVRGMFLLAAGLAAMAIFWPRIGPKVSRIDDLLVEVAGSRIAWFLIGAVLATFFFLRSKSFGAEGTVAISSVSIKHGLYVGEILAGFDKLREDYVIEIGIRAYNGTGEAISLSGITGAIRFGIFSMQDTYEPLPPAVLLDRGQRTNGIPIFTEMLFILEQRMPSQSAMKLLATLDEGEIVAFDLRKFNILLSLDSNPNETERLPVFSITFQKHETIAQGRIAYLEARLAG